MKSDNPYRSIAEEALEAAEKVNSAISSKVDEVYSLAHMYEICSEAKKALAESREILARCDKMIESSVYELKYATERANRLREEFEIGSHELLLKVAEIVKGAK